MNISKFRPNVVLATVNNTFRRSVTVAATVDRSEVYEKEQLKSWEEIPGPRTLPVIGAMHHYLPGGLFYNYKGMELVEKLYNTYGPIIRLEGIIGKDPQILLYDAESCAQILRSENWYPVRPGLESLEYYRRYVRKDAIKGRPTGVITDKGDEWKELRSAINPILLKPQIIKLYTPALDAIGKEMLTRIKSQRNENNRLKTKFEDEMSLWALESTGVVALGYRMGCLDPDLSEDSVSKKLINCAHEEFKLVEKLDYSPTLWRILPTPNFKKAMDFYALQERLSKQVIGDAIKHFKNKANPDFEKSVLEKLLEINEEYAMRMTSDMLFSGIDSISNTVTATLYLLAANPDKQKKLREELRSNDENDKRPYLKACVKESIRMMPISVGTRRVTSKEYNLMGYRIPPNTYVNIGQQFMSMMEEHYPRPKEYLPERWLVDAKDPLNYRHAHSFAHSPFGFGVRSCAARRIASLVMELFIAKMVDGFEIEWDGPPPKIRKDLINYVNGPLHFVFKDAA